MIHCYFHFLQGLIDSDVRGKVTFSFKSKGLGKQKLKNTVPSLLSEVVEWSEIQGE